jgi:hypothetical protein
VTSRHGAHRANGRSRSRPRSRSRGTDGQSGNRAIGQVGQSGTDCSARAERCQRAGVRRVERRRAEVQLATPVGPRRREHRGAASTARTPNTHKQSHERAGAKRAPLPARDSTSWRQ